jgi:magnesium transporter
MSEHTLSRRGELLASTARRMLRRGGRARLSRLIGRERTEDVGYLLSRLTPAEKKTVFDILVADYPDSAGSVLADLEAPLRAELLGFLDPDRVARVLEHAAVDDAVFIVDSLPGELKERVLEIVDLEEQLAEVQGQLAYGDESAGRIMDTELVAVRADVDVATAIRTMRERASEVDMISYLYVVDDEQRLIGVASLRQLLLAEPESRLGDVMTASVLKVTTDTDQEEVAHLASRYDLLAIPVVDAHERLVGIVTVDDILDVFRDEATEDFFKMAGTSDDEILYQDRSWRVAGIRLPWLLVNLVGLLIAGALMRSYQETFGWALLIGFVPVIIGTAGNIGTQTATIAVRGLATGQLPADGQGFGQFLWRQTKVGLVLGAVCATLGAAAAALMGGTHPAVGLAVGISQLIAILLASVNGVVIPMLFKRIGVDPAVAAGPLVTTGNDVLGMLVYFGVTMLLASHVGLA